MLLNGTGLYCLNCHASAIANSDTYSSTAFLASGSGSVAVGAVSDAVNEMAPFKIEDTSDAGGRAGSGVRRSNSELGLRQSQTSRAP